MALNFPPNPTVGQVYTVGNESWQWDGHCWNIAVGTATYAPVHIGQFPPGSPIAGDLWWNSTTGTLCVYYADVDGSQWVSAVQVPDPKVSLTSTEVVNSFLEELTPYANIAAAVGAGVATGQLFRVTGLTGASAIRAVASYGGGAGTKGQKGEVGTKGQKGEAGTNGTNGTKGEKGQEGAAGGAGTKGQKGEVGTGTKGQKGEVGVGTKGQKGQDGAAGSNGSNGTKGQKGQEGAAATKGQKGEVGVGTKGQKGQDGAAGSNGTNGTKGQKGQDGTAGGTGAKGQKGQTGAGTPVGSNAEIQFNDNGAFGSSANLTWNDSLNVLQALSATIVNCGAGALTVSGNTTLGDASTDTITLTGSVSGNILPLTNNTSNFGSTALKWNNIYGNVLHGTDLTLSGNTTMSLSNYADDTAAATGGIGIGQLYRNGSVVQIRVS